VAVVGSRRATRHGSVPRDDRKGLGDRGIVVVSGLARGIDAAAHRGALASPSRTIAVLGSGLARMYPREHEELAARIAARGAVISEYPSSWVRSPTCSRAATGGQRPFGRNVVIEAGRASGALVTARLTLDQGRELFAVPGSILDGGCDGSNGLLVEGVAHLAISPRRSCVKLPPTSACGSACPHRLSMTRLNH